MKRSSPGPCAWMGKGPSEMLTWCTRPRTLSVTEFSCRAAIDAFRPRKPPRTISEGSRSGRTVGEVSCL